MIVPRNIAFATFLLITCAGFAQNSGSRAITVGTVNGTPILLSHDSSYAQVAFWYKHHKLPASPADDAELSSLKSKERCSELESRLKAFARDEQKKRLNISISDEEAADAAKQYWNQHDFMAEFEHDHRVALATLSAMSDVYDRHLDPQQVYEKTLAPLGLPKDSWASDLIKWANPESRARAISSQSAIASATLDSYRKAIDQASRKWVESQKLDETVDDEIAAKDPTFREYLAEMRRSTTKVSPFESHGKPTLQSHGDYLRNARMAWWQSRYAELDVRLQDPALANQCQPHSALRLKH